jgi:hypothetical protein
MTITKNDILFWTGILLALWFGLTGIAWTYWAALIIAYPAGLASFLIWRSIKSEKKRRTKIIPIILMVGLIVSLSTLTYFLIFD